MPIHSRYPTLPISRGGTGAHTADAARTNLGVATTGNMLINGDFSIAQRGTTFTSTTTPANNDDTYLLDRWILLADGADTVDVSQETTTVPASGRTAILLDVETGNRKFGILQIIESTNSKRGIGANVSLSFDARRNGSSIDRLRSAVIAWSGAADAVTSDIVSAWGGAGTDPTLIANCTYENTPTNHDLTGSYQRFTVQNIAVDTASTANILVFIWIDDVTVTVGDFVYISNVQLEVAPVATPFQYRAFQDELLRCQRYYCKTFPYSTAPVQNGGVDGALSRFSPDVNPNTLLTFWRFPVEMRAAPTVTTYNPSVANANWRDVTGGGDRGAVTDNVASSGVGITSNVAVSQFNDHKIHASADAEL